MSDFQSWFLACLLNSLWQLPLVFAAAWIAARVARPLGPRFEHRIWVAALLAEAVLPFWTLDPIRLGLRLWALLAFAWHASPAGGHVQVIIGPATMLRAGFLRLPPQLVTVLFAAYFTSLIYFAIRLGWGLWKTHRLLVNAIPAPCISAGSSERWIQGEFDGLSSSGAAYPATIAISKAIFGPVTVGLRRHILLIPPGFLNHLEEADLRALLAHEFAHMRRRDFAKNLLYELLSLPITFHPVLWLTRTRLAATREMTCDEIAGDAIPAGREGYARSLLHLASMLAGQTPVEPLHAIGIFDANIFERRVMNLTLTRPRVSTLRSASIAVLCAAVALSTCVSATALRLEAASNQTGSQGPTENPKSIHVKANNLKLTTEVRPVYPPKAKAAGIEGSVLLDATISKEGIPENLKVVKGPHDLQMSALDAVRQWRWQPYLLNGDPIEVQTTITVVYSSGK